MDSQFCQSRPSRPLLPSVGIRNASARLTSPATDVTVKIRETPKPISKGREIEYTSNCGHPRRGALIAALAFAPASAQSGAAAFNWPYFGPGSHAVPSETMGSDASVQSMISLMEAFGATESQAETIAAFQPTDVTSDLGEEAIPDALTQSDPSRVERGRTTALAAEIEVYDDGSLALSLTQRDEFTDPTDTAISFDSATVDFGEIARSLDSNRNSTLESPLATSSVVGSNEVAPTGSSISGCDSLPAKNGWTRRADCWVYSSTTLHDLSASFYFDYSVKAGRGRIDKVYGADRQCWGTASGSLYIARKLNAGSTPALAINEIHCNIGGVKTVDWQQHVYAYGSAWSELV